MDELRPGKLNLNHIQYNFKKEIFLSQSIILFSTNIGFSSKIPVEKPPQIGFAQSSNPQRRLKISKKNSWQGTTTHSRQPFFNLQWCFPQFSFFSSCQLLVQNTEEKKGHLKEKFLTCVLSEFVNSSLQKRKVRTPKPMQAQRLNGLAALLKIIPLNIEINENVLYNFVISVAVRSKGEIQAR